MPKVKINRHHCKSCELCIKFCPKHLLKLDKIMNGKGVYPVIFIDDNNQCIGCGFCATMCPEACIEITNDK